MLKWNLERQYTLICTCNFSLMQLFLSMKHICSFQKTSLILTYIRGCYCMKLCGWRTEPEWLWAIIGKQCECSVSWVVYVYDSGGLSSSTFLLQPFHNKASQIPKGWVWCMIDWSTPSANSPTVSSIVLSSGNGVGPLAKPWGNPKGPLLSSMWMATMGHLARLQIT